MAVSFVLMGTAAAKASVGTFLLRIAFERWQRLLVWCSIGLFTACCVGTSSAGHSGGDGAVADSIRPPRQSCQYHRMDVVHAFRNRVGSPGPGDLYRHDEPTFIVSRWVCLIFDNAVKPSPESIAMTLAYTDMVGLASACTIVMDLLYAVLPWLLLWGASKPRSEKFLIGGSLSLGIV